MWFGEQWDVAYDPRRIGLLKTGPDLQPDTRRRLVGMGYQTVMSDGRGGALWSIDVRQLHIARLDQLSQQDPEPRDPGLGLP
jgi:hypothetical protein